MSTMTESWDVWSAGEKDQFQSIARKLLRQTFLVRDKDEESRRNYFFLSRTLDTFQEYFGYIGFEIILDRDNGVGMLRSTVSAGEGGRMQIGHLRLRKGESLVLCCLWTIYADRVLSGTLRQTIQITLADLRMEMGKYGFQDQMARIGDQRNFGCGIGTPKQKDHWLFAFVQKCDHAIGKQLPTFVFMAVRSSLSNGKNGV